MSSVRMVFWLIAGSAILFVAGCASWQSGASGASSSATRPGTTTPRSQIPSFSGATPGASIPEGWEPYIIHPRKKRTRYEVAIEQGEPVLRATASGSASGLFARLDVDPATSPFIEWRWRTEALLDEADNTDPALEDAPVRLILAFDGDKSSLPVRDQMFFERARLFTGLEMPYATLMYIWGNQQPVGTILPNPHTSRIQKVVVCNRTTGVRQWQQLRRNIVEDYERAFGKPPGRLIGVAIMSDTDNTNGHVAAHYGDIRLTTAESYAR